MSKLQLISFNLCPFVQRAVISLQEKGVEYDITYIDLADKPDWFLEISPLGKVPVLKVGDEVLFESMVIAEYLDEVVPPQLHPADPLEKAKHRAWVEFIGGLAGPGYVLMVAQDEETAFAQAEKAREKLARLETKVVGPFFSGEHFSLLDACAAPFLQRLAWAQRIAPELKIFDDTPKVWAWVENLLSRDSVKKSLLPEIDEVYVAYISGRGSPARQAPASWLSTQVA